MLDAIKVLAREDIGAAIVMTGDRLAGILSERDYTRKVDPQGPLRPRRRGSRRS